MPHFSSYAASKVAVMRLTEKIAHETAGFGSDMNAVAPGALNTRMLDEVLAAGPECIGQSYYEKAVQQKTNGGVPLNLPPLSPSTSLSTESDGISGRLLRAVWDPWRNLAQRAGELARTDVYTLRRIVPKEHGLDWDES